MLRETLALTIACISMLSLKPIVSYDLNHKLPSSLSDVPTGTYYIKAKLLLVYQDENYMQPKDTNFEIKCAGRGLGSAWDNGYVIKKYKHTDQSDYCTQVNTKEYNNVVSNTH